MKLIPNNLVHPKERTFSNKDTIILMSCSLVVDMDHVITTIVEARLVQMLNLTPLPLPKSYKLHWVNKGGDMVMN